MSIIVINIIYQYNRSLWALVERGHIVHRHELITIFGVRLPFEAPHDEPNSTVTGER